MLRLAQIHVTPVEASLDWVISELCPIYKADKDWAFRGCL
jgi:hypothetical protein